MQELEALQAQLEEARDEAELNLLQLQQVQEELEFYFLRCQDLERELTERNADGNHPGESAEIQAATSSDAPPATTPTSGPSAEELAQLEQQVALHHQELEELKRRREQDQQLLGTAQSMLEGQARYLEDVSLREERAAQALDRIRLLEAEVLYYLRHSKPLPSLDPSRVNRLVELAKQPAPRS